MPTDEWFKENPKVSAYIPQNLNEKLTEWMKGRSIKKVSQALTAILEEYLGVVQTEPITQPVRDDRLEALEQKFESLSRIVQELREPIQASSQKLVQTELPLVVQIPVEEPLSVLEAIALLDAKQPIEVVEKIQDDEPDEILYEFIEPETQTPDVSLKEEVIKESEEESSPIVENSGLKAETTNSELPQPMMTSKEAAKLLNWTEDKVRSRHKRSQTFEEKGYKFMPSREKDKPIWKVEKLEDEF